MDKPAGTNSIMDYDILDSLSEDLSPYEQAKLMLRQGYPLPVDLTTTLMAQGYDISELETLHSY